MVQLRQAEHSRELAPEWLALQRFYKQDPYWALIFERVLYPITHKMRLNHLKPILHRNYMVRS